MATAHRNDHLHHQLQGALIGAIAIACGALSAIVTFFAPVLIYGSDDILLIWGWIAPVIAIPIAFAVGWLVKTLVRGIVSGAPPSRILLVYVSSILFIAACGYRISTFGDVSLAWSEQIVLQDGPTLVVQRGVIGNSFGRSRTRPEDWLPTSFSLDISKALSEAPIWRSSLRPLLLDTVTPSGNPVVVAEPKTCGEWYQLGKPNPPFVAYELRHGTWTQIEVPSQFLGRSPNLLRSPKFTGEHSPIQASEVELRNNVGPKDAWPVIRVFDHYC